MDYNFNGGVAPDNLISVPFHTHDGINSPQISAESVTNVNGLLLGGSGADGDVTISVDTSLTRDMYYNSLTVSSGFTLNPAGFRIYVKNTLTVSGTIARNGNAGGAGGTSTSDTGGTGGTAGAALANGTIKGGLVGIAGAAGASSADAGGIATDGTAGTNEARGFGTSGATGGAGGTAPTGGDGGTGGTVTATNFRPWGLVHANNLYDFVNSALIGYNGGGGSGGGGMSAGAPANGGGGGGGGSGSNGGIVFIEASTIVVETGGVISANGGAGGAGGNGKSDGNVCGGGGGGAGGSGGIVILVYESLTNNGSVTASGAAGGAKGISNTSGTQAGLNDGVAGGTGTAGTVIQITPDTPITGIQVTGGDVTLDYGTYTPTLTNVTNLDGSTAYQCQYMRVGTTVTVSGKVDANATATGSTQLGISLPITSNLGAAEDCAGAAFCPAVADQGAAILGDATNNRAQMEWVAVNTGNQSMYFTFSYQII